MYAAAASITGGISTFNSSKNSADGSGSSFTTIGVFQNASLELTAYTSESYNAQYSTSFRTSIEPDAIYWYRKPSGTTSARCILSLINYTTSGATYFGRNGADSSHPGAFIHFTNGLSTVSDTSATALGYLEGTWYGSITTSSSRNVKTDISKLSDKHSVLFDNLIPRVFRYINGSRGRLHYGYIVDELKSALDIAELTTAECAAYCLVDTESPDGDGGIRYDELSVLTAREVQLLKARIVELETIIAKFKEE